MPTVASGANSSLAYVRETAFGTTPATPAFTSVPFVSSSLDLTRGVLEDNSIQSNRQRQAQRLGNISATGSIATVLRYGTYDWLLENLMLNTFSSNILKVGQTRISDSIEVAYHNLPQFRVFKGLVVNQAVFNIPTNGVVTSQFDLLGSSTSRYSGATFTGATTTPAATQEGLTHLGGLFLEGGAPVGVFTSLQFTVSNNYQQTYVLGFNEVHDCVYGDLKVTGSVVAYFEDATFANKFIDETPTSLDFTLTDTPGNKVQFIMPAVRYSGAQTPISNSGPVTLTMPFEASYDSTAATTLEIIRTPHS